MSWNKDFDRAVKAAGLMTVSQELRFYRGKYDGKPCKVCGEPLRYKSNKRCVECKHRMDSENYERRKERKAIEQRHSVEVV